jgi:hypothetical protein
MKKMMMILLSCSVVVVMNAKNYTVTNGTNGTISLKWAEANKSNPTYQVTVDSGKNFTVTTAGDACYSLIGGEGVTDWSRNVCNDGKITGVSYGAYQITNV